MSDESSDNTERTPAVTCDRCGASLIPLSIVHIQRTCRTCGKMTYVAEMGDNGQGIKVRQGDQLVVPPGTIRLSLDRSKASGKFTRAGIAWFASMLLFSGAPETFEGVGDLIAKYFSECQAVLRQSRDLADLDLETDVGVQAALDRISSTDHLRGSIEQWAFTLGSALAEATQALDQNDAQRAAWAMNRATNARAILIFKRELEDLMWRGYLTESLRDVLKVWQDNQQNSNEEFWQQTLAEWPLVFSQAFATPVIVLQGKAYVGGKRIDNSQGNVTDFLVTNPLSENVTLIEIKTPKTRLLGSRYRAGVYPISGDVAGAIAQVATQRDSLLKEFDRLANVSETRFSAFSPRGLVIVGNLRSELTDTARLRSFELFHQSLRDIQLITFDELFSKVEGLLKSLIGDG